METKGKFCQSFVLHKHIYQIYIQKFNHNIGLSNQKIVSHVPMISVCREECEMENMTKRQRPYQTVKFIFLSIGVCLRCLSQFT